MKKFLKKYWPLLALITLIIAGKIVSSATLDLKVKNYNNAIIDIQEKTLQDSQPLQQVFGRKDFDVKQAIAAFDTVIANMQKHFDEFEKVERNGYEEMDIESIEELHDAMRNYFEVDLDGLKQMKTMLTNIKDERIRPEDFEKFRLFYLDVTKKEKEAINNYQQTKNQIQNRYQQAKEEEP